MFVWSYWKTIFTRPSSPSKEVPAHQKWTRRVLNALLQFQTTSSFAAVTHTQFCLPKAEKERYEKEERPESQQEILWRAAASLPLYTRTGAGGVFSACVQMRQWMSINAVGVVFDPLQPSDTVTAVRSSNQTGVITAPHVTCKTPSQAGLTKVFGNYSQSSFLFSRGCMAGVCWRWTTIVPGKVVFSAFKCTYINDLLDKSVRQIQIASLTNADSDLLLWPGI